MNTGAHDQADCNTCHGDFDSFQQFSCTTCHEHSQELTDPTHVGVADYAWTGTKCFECHPDGQASAVDHTAVFPHRRRDDARRDLLRHLPRGPEEPQGGGLHQLPHHAATDQRHSQRHPQLRLYEPQVPGVPPQGTIPGIDHTFFPIGTGTVHTGLSCASCHPDRTNRKVTDCISCHTHAATETHASTTASPTTPIRAPSAWSATRRATIPGIDHTAFFPTHLGATHGGISCRQCHPDRAQRQVLDCLTCHTSTATDPRHTTVGGYARNSSLCVRCHAESQVDLVSTHLPFNIRLGTKHYRTSCLTCHPTSRTDKPWAQNFDPFDCLSCHPKTKMDDTHQGRSGYSYVSTTCVNSGCHQNGQKP